MAVNESKISKFEEHVKTLPNEIQEEVRKTDEYLTKKMEKNFKLKRTIDKYGNVTYISPWGFRYKIRRINAGELHDIQWIGYNTNREKEKFGERKAFYFLEIFNKLAEKDLELANEIFSDNIYEHIVGKICPACKFPDCRHVKTYEFNGKVKTTCGSAIQFKWTSFDFENVRKVVESIHEVIIDANNAV